jgi:hypothetical protein
MPTTEDAQREAQAKAEADRIAAETRRVQDMIAAQRAAARAERNEARRKT